MHSVRPILQESLPNRNPGGLTLGNAIHVVCESYEASVENLDWAVTRPYWRSEVMHCGRCGSGIPCLRNALVLETPARALFKLFGQAPQRAVRTPDSLDSK